MADERNSFLMINTGLINPIIQFRVALTLCDVEVD